MMRTCAIGVPLVLALCLGQGLALAAGDQWVVVKDKGGVCTVISSKVKTPETIAGPFGTKKKAEEAKTKVCPEGTEQTAAKHGHQTGEAHGRLSSAAEKIKHKAGEELAKVSSIAGKVKHKTGEELAKVSSTAEKIEDKVKEGMTKAKAAARRLKERIKGSTPPDKKE